jgi:hypothetical protein
MPKKGEGSAKNAGANANSNANVNITKMTKEQIAVYAFKLLEEIEREREERNYFQLERDNIQTFWDITRQQLQESRQMNRILEKNTQDFSKKFDEEALEYRKKFRHLMYTYQTEAANSNVENLVALKKFQNQFLRQKNEIYSIHKNNLKIENECHLAALNQSQALKLAHRKTLETMKDVFNQDRMDIQNKYDSKITQYHKQFSLKHNMEMLEVEERKNEHMNTLIKEHENAYQEIKSFYNDIITNNLSVIENLKEKFSQMKKNESKLMSQLKALKHKNN